MLGNEVIIFILIGIVIYLIYMSGDNTNSKKMPKEQMQTTTKMPMGQMPMGQMPPGQMPSGQMPPGQMPPLSIEDMPTIKNILTEIGNNQAKPEQLERLEKAVKDTIEESKTTALKIVEDAKNAPKDKNGQPILDKKIITLYMLMLMLFMGSEGKYFKNEIGPEIEKSYGSMPQK